MDEELLVLKSEYLNEDDEKKKEKILRKINMLERKLKRKKKNHFKDWTKKEN